MRLSQLASEIGAEVVGDPEAEVRAVATLHEATAGQVSFLANPKYRPLLARTAASAVIVRPEDRVGGINLLVTRDPYLAFAKAVSLLHPVEHPRRGVEAGAHVHPTARLGANVTVLAGAAVEEAAEIGEGTVLYPGVYVGREARIGRHCILYPNAVVREQCVLGDRVILQPGAVIGSDGFGYARDGARQVKIPQVGIVVLEDDVEVGASTTVDRAALGETRVGRGTKIDNLVQVGHNVTVGEDCVIVAQAGIAGSSRLGNRVVLAGQAAVAGHISLGDGVMVGGQSGVAADVEPRAVVSGSPAFPHREWVKASLVYKKLPELRHKVLELERRLASLEAGIGESSKPSSEAPL